MHPILILRGVVYAGGTMNNKAYSSFTAIDGTKFAFADYASFALWFFSHSRRVVQAAFPADVFSSIERAATQSREARCRRA